jgi:hypothetical protein
VRKRRRYSLSEGILVAISGLEPELFALRGRTSSNCTALHLIA